MEDLSSESAHSPEPVSTLVGPHDPTNEEFVPRPLERTVAFIAIVVASILSFALLVREIIAATPNVALSELIFASSAVICVSTAISRLKQDEAFAPKWAFLTYPLILAAAVYVPVSAAWAAQEGIGQAPAMLPGLLLFVCLVAPFAVPNQMAFGLGSLIPKCLLMSAAMHFTDNTDWGIYAANHLVSPQTAIAALALFTALVGTIFIAVKMSLPSWAMILLGAIITFPCIHQFETPLVVFHVL